MFGALPAHGLYVRHVEGLTLRNVRLRVEQADARPAAVFDDVKDLQLDGLRPASGSAVALHLNDVVGATVDSSRPIGDGRGTLRVSGARSKEIHVSEDSLLDVTRN
jgi:hypothetical protein